MKLFRQFYNSNLLADRLLFLVTTVGVLLDGWISGAFTAHSPENAINRFLMSIIGAIYLGLTFSKKFNRDQIRVLTYSLVGLFMVQITYLNYVYRFNFDTILLFVVMMLIGSLYFRTIAGVTIFLVLSVTITIVALMYVEHPLIDPKLFIPRVLLGSILGFGLSRANQVFQRRLHRFSEKVYEQNQELERMKVKLETLLANRQMLSLVADKTTNAVIISDRDDGIEWVNGGFTRITGYTLDEVRGKGPEFLRGPLTDPNTIRRIEELAKSGQPFIDDILNYRKDGTPIWLHIQVTPILNEKGEVEKYISIQEDITGSRVMQESLRQSSERLHEAQRLAKIGNWELNLDTKQMRCSPEINEIFGMLRGQEMTYDSYERFVHPDDLPLLQQAILYATERKSPFELDHRILVDGKIKFLYCTGEALPDSEGQFRRLFVTIQDITDRKRIEEELRLTELRFRKLFDNTQNLICTHGPNGQFYSINPLGAQALGYAPEEMIGRNLREIVHLETRHLFDQYLEQIMKTGFAKGVLKTQNRDGTTGYWMYRNVLLEEVDGRPYVLCSGVDVTEQYKAERELTRAKEMAEKALITKDRFVANISHEMRTPMNAIIGFSEALQRLSMNAEQKEWVNAIRTASENLLMIINDILDLSKIESGRVDFVDEIYSIREVMIDVQRLLMLRAREKKIELSFDCDENVPAYVTGDALKLNQVLLNLVGNAVKFTARGSVHFHCRVKDSDAETCVLEFTVKDTGIGIASDKLIEVFEPFTQASSNADREHGGTGLGLNIARDLIELQGGRIDVQSTLGEGTQFTFTLPVKRINEEQVKEVEQALQPIPTGQALRVLLVEDHPLNQQLAMKLINDFGFKATLAVNGRAAVDILKHETFDVVLMDLQMPEMDGYTATSIIRNELKLDVPIIAMTAHSMAGEREHCLELGMNDYLSKPFRAKDLYLKIAGSVQHDLKAAPNTAEQPEQTPLKALSGGDKQFEQEMIQMLLKSIPDDFSNLQKAAAASDWTKVKSTAHRLKSAVALSGAKKFAAALEGIEQDKSVTVPADITSRVNELKKMQDLLLVDLQRMAEEN